MPSEKPKTAYELQKVFHSIQKYPETMQEYVSKLVPPEQISLLWKKTAIEPDVLAQIIATLCPMAKAKTLDTAQVKAYLEAIGG